MNFRSYSKNRKKPDASRISRLVCLCFVGLSLASLSFVGCGRKNNDFLNFDKKKPSIKVNRLTLPAVRGLELSEEANGLVSLKWTPVKKEPQQSKLLGYNVYKFSRIAFVPKKPVNKSPIEESFFEEIFVQKKSRRKIFIYAVRPVFRIKGRIFEGPLSKIVSLLESPPTNLAK